MYINTFPPWSFCGLGFFFDQANPKLSTSDNSFRSPTLSTTMSTTGKTEIFHGKCACGAVKYEAVLPTENGIPAVSSNYTLLEPCLQPVNTPPHVQIKHKIKETNLEKIITITITIINFLIIFFYKIASTLSLHLLQTHDGLLLHPQHRRGRARLSNPARRRSRATSEILETGDYRFRGYHVLLLKVR